MGVLYAAFYDIATTVGTSAVDSKQTVQAGNVGRAGVGCPPGFRSMQPPPIVPWGGAAEGTLLMGAHAT